MAIITGAALIGSAVTASKIGAMMVNFKKDRCEKKIAELEGLIARLENHQTKLENLKNRIPAFWEDDRATAVKKALDRTMGDVSKKMTTAKELVVTYKAAMEGFEKAEEYATGLVEDALGILESLD